MKAWVLLGVPWWLSGVKDLALTLQWLWLLLWLGFNPWPGSFCILQVQPKKKKKKKSNRVSVKTTQPSSSCETLEESLSLSVPNLHPLIKEDSNAYIIGIELTYV